MKLATTAYEFDVAKMADEALVVLARECPHLGARQELILRHFSRAAYYIGALARNMGLGPEDTEEARQNAEFGIEEAIDHYDLAQLARKYGKTFRQYLRQVVGCRFRDFVKHIRREARHYDHSGEAVHALEQATDNRVSRFSSRNGATKLNDPVHKAIRNEDLQRLRMAASRLPEKSRLIWERLCAGMKLAQIAEDLHLTNDQANHRKRKMYAQLVALLGNETPED